MALAEGWEKPYPAGQLHQGLGIVMDLDQRDETKDQGESLVETDETGLTNH